MNEAIDFETYLIISQEKFEIFLFFPDFILTL